MFMSLYTHSLSEYHASSLTRQVHWNTAWRHGCAFGKRVGRGLRERDDRQKRGARGWRQERKTRKRERVKKRAHACAGGRKFRTQCRMGKPSLCLSPPVVRQSIAVQSPVPACRRNAAASSKCTCSSKSVGSRTWHRTEPAACYTSRTWAAWQHVQSPIGCRCAWQSSQVRTTGRHCDHCCSFWSSRRWRDASKTTIQAACLHTS